MGQAASSRQRIVQAEPGSPSEHATARLGSLTGMRS